MFHVDLAPLGGILDPLKSDLGVFWAKIPLSSDWFYNVKTQKMQILQNSQWEMAEIDNIHCTICTQPIPSSRQNGLPPALATSVQQGVFWSMIILNNRSKVCFKTQINPIDDWGRGMCLHPTDDSPAIEILETIGTLLIEAFIVTFTRQEI